MSRANALWGAPRIHGELLVAFEVAQSTVARYMCRHSRPPSQGWRTFLSNHADGFAAIDLFVLPTIVFQILYCLVIVRHGRRLWISFGVTANPTAEWISLSLLKTPKRRENLEIFASLTYRRGHDHDSFCPCVCRKFDSARREAGTR
jgi:hypothetical protein